MYRFCLFILALFVSSWLRAGIDVYEFPSEADRQRYIALTEELRCPKCQNQNLSGSNSPIASDLRREIHRLIVAGQSDEQIIDFMVSRYGDFVLYRPPLRSATALLWLAPLALLLIAVGVLVWMVGRRKSTDVAAEPALTELERQKLESLLAESDTDKSETGGDV